MRCHMATVENTAPAEAPSPAVIAEALELRRLIKSVLASDPPIAVAAQPGGHCHPHDRTDNRIRAYLASMRPLRGVGAYREDIEDAHARGRGLIERLALSAEGSGLPQLELTSRDVADVLSLMSALEPIERGGWWLDGNDDPSPVCGFYLLLHALEESLRAMEPASGTHAPAGASDAPQERTPGQEALARLMYRLDVATDMLAVVTNCDDWSRPGNLPSGFLGQVAIVRAASKQLIDIYCALTEWAGDH